LAALDATPNTTTPEAIQQSIQARIMTVAKAKSIFAHRDTPEDMGGPSAVDKRRAYVVLKRSSPAHAKRASRLFRKPATKSKKRA
jgi:hypothetical protein